MIFIDSNIPMYLVGAAHPNKERARQLLEQCITRGERLVTDAEVLQEILNRYVAIKRRDGIQSACDALLKVVDQVYPIELTDVERAKGLLHGLISLSARNALHVAIMERYDVQRLLSFDRGFDQVGWIERVGAPLP